jgi:hypothetical protein
MFSAGAIKSNGEIIGKAFSTKEEAEEFLLNLMETNELKQARIRNLATGEEEKII